ncbi:MAG: alpha/beta hydrolase [Anaerolineales bacterium]|nr:alpha/beta hydrolase [Anaerolineales bacterium]
MHHLADFTNPTIAKLYAGVPSEVIQKFRDFCDAYPYRSIRYRGIDWPYLISSGGVEPLLMLSGALTHPDISWNSIAHFGERYRIVVPAYPAVRTMDELSDGIAAILQHEGISRAHVMGGSYGGFVGQVFVRRFPAVTRSLILSHTTVPDPTGGQSTRRMLKVLSLLPTAVLRALLGRMLGKLMPADASSPEMLLMLAQFREIMDHHLAKADFLGILDRTLDFYGRSWTAEDLAGWGGKILLVLAEDDPASPERVRTAFKELYPRAEWKLFRGGGHTTSVTDQAEYQAAIDGFLQAQS